MVDSNLSKGRVTSFSRVAIHTGVTCPRTVILEVGKTVLSTAQTTTIQQANGFQNYNPKHDNLKYEKLILANLW